MSVLMLSSLTGFAEEGKVVVPKLVEKVKTLHKMKVKKLEIELQKTPEFNFSGARAKRSSKNQEWLEIEAKIEVDTVSKNTFLPTLDATFTIVYFSAQGYQKIERTIQFKNVNIEDGEAYVVGYIDPDTLRVITGKKRPSIRDITGVAVAVSTNNLSKKNPNDLHKSELFDHKLKLDEAKAWWTSKKIIVSEQKILAHDETPFELARPERYPLVVKK